MRMEYALGYINMQVEVGHAMLDVDGCMVPVDEDGCLVNPADWTVSVARHMADEDGIELSDDHLLLLYFLSHFYREYEVAPNLGVIRKNLCKGVKQCRWTRAYIVELFPEGARMACRYAGLPSPMMGNCV